MPAAVCGLGWCSLRRGNYKANTTLTVLNLRYNSVEENGAIALAAALKATVMTCTHEFREDALVSCSPMRLKQLMRLCSCFPCCFLCLKGTAHHDVWHSATTNQWNSRLITLGILTFFCMCLTQLCVRAVRRCTLDSTVVVSNVHREGGGTKSIFSPAMEGFVFVLQLDMASAHGVHGGADGD